MTPPTTEPTALTSEGARRQAQAPAGVRRRTTLAATGLVLLAVLGSSCTARDDVAADAGAGAGQRVETVATLEDTTEVTVGAAPSEVTIAPDVSAPAAPPVAPTGSDASSSEGAPTSATTSPPATLPQTARVGLPPAGQEPKNVLGQPVRLDETAALACAHGEFALEAMDLGEIAGASRLATEVARWGRPSANADVAAAAVRFAETFAAAPNRDAVAAFLDVCAASGHQRR